VLAGRYELKQKLGSGGMATVYEAHDGLLDRAVAVKLLRSDTLSEPVARQRFAAEARAAASLTHPHAVAVYDVNSGEDQPFIVMELVRGRTLEDVLRDDRQLSDDQVVSVGSQVLTALHVAHRRGLVHRDVKPANILLPGGIVPTRPEELPGVKLADFGIAKAATDATAGLTVAGQVIGTPKYLSPEQVKGERATAQSDLYATAVVLYEMFAGRPPFDRDTALALALAHREDEPPPLGDLRPDLNPNIVALVHRTLSKNPADRPADANEMRDALITAATSPRGTQVLGAAAASTEVVEPGGPGGPIGPTQPVRPAPFTPPPRRRRRTVWVVLLILLGILGVAAALWLANRAPGQPTNDQQTAPPAAEQRPETEAPQGGAGDQPDTDQGQQDTDTDTDQGQPGTDTDNDQGPDQGQASEPADEQGNEQGNEGSGGDGEQEDPQQEDPPAEDEDPGSGEEPPPPDEDEEEEPVEDPSG
jgi:tRNA A-37 threonylcarbamoyl transferase component Bud32